jgi:hypothetical protein
MKKNKIIYWSVTGLVSAGFLMSSFMYLSQNAQLMEEFAKIGVPAVLVSILGVAKLLGAIALINPWFKGIKEWAYAGFTFVLIGAVWVHVATQTPFVAPLLFLVLLGVSYFYSRKLTRSGVPQVAGV